MLGLKKKLYLKDMEVVGDEKVVVSGIVSMVDYIKKDINLRIEEKNWERRKIMVFESKRVTNA